MALPTAYRALLLLALAGSLLACSSPRSSGSSRQPCDRSSDCPNPTDRCVDGRCANECGDDRDCLTGLSCVDGVCAEEGQPCRGDRDCRFNQECAEGLCRQIDHYCEQNRDCPNGSLCDGAARRCIAEAGHCIDEADCVQDERCLNAVCVPANVEPCTSDAACADNLICVHGRCEPECVQDRDCAATELCVNQRCVPDPANNGTTNNGTTNNATGCLRNPALCQPSEECCDDVCVLRGTCPECLDDRDCTAAEVCTAGQCTPVATNNGQGTDDYWDTCTAASECASNLCLGDPAGVGRCVVRCAGRFACPQAPVSSFCITGDHLVTQQPGGEQLIGLCYQDDTGATCNPSVPNNCLDGLCIGRAPTGQIEGQCTLRCHAAADCGAGMACGPKEFNVNGQAQLIDVCVPIGEICAGTGPTAADQCFSSFCVTDEGTNVGRCTTLCVTGAECPPGWGCVDAGGTGICWQ